MSRFLNTSQVSTLAASANAFRAWSLQAQCQDIVSGNATLSPPARTKPDPTVLAERASAAKPSRRLQIATGMRATAAPRLRKSPRKPKPKRRGRRGCGSRCPRWGARCSRCTSTARWPRREVGFDEGGLHLALVALVGCRCGCVQGTLLPHRKLHAGFIMAEPQRCSRVSCSPTLVS